MRRREDASTRPRRVRVRWKDGTVGGDMEGNYAALHPPSPLRPRPRGGWGMSAPSASQSAAATLAIYLSDALGGSHADPMKAQPPLRHRRVQPIGSSLVDISLDQEHTKPITGGEDREMPGSPLSRFLKKRSGVLEEVTSTASRLRDFISEPHRDSSTWTPRSAPAGSMERLLMERIREAKSMRDTRGTSSSSDDNQENWHPNAASPPHAIAVAVSTEDMGDFSTEVPTPHPKPQKPQLLQMAAASLMPHSPPEDAPIPVTEETSVEASAGEKALVTTTTRAARCIQSAWRRRLLRKRRYDEQVVELCDQKFSCEETDGKEEQFAPDCPIESHPTDTSDIATPGAVEYDDPQANSSSETDTLDTLQDEELIVSRAVRWVDDECVFLEEGRFPLFELLDPAALEVDSSLEALVLKKPHMFVEVQETKRLEQQQVWRAHRRQSSNGSERVESSEKLARDLTGSCPQKRSPLIHVTFVRRRKRSPFKSSKMKRKLKHGQIQIEHKREDPTPRSFNAADTVSDQPEVDTEAEDATARLLVDQLSHYVVISDADQNESSSNEERNDLIAVIEAASSRESEPDEEDETPNDNDDEASDAVSSISNQKRLEDATPPSQDGYVALYESSYGFRAENTLALFPTVRQTELEVKRTLDRIQAQYSLDQQRLIDAYADDAVFTTFFSPPMSPVDGDQQSQQLLALPHRPASVVEASEDSYGSAATFNSLKQREFLQALDEFRESLRASMASTTHSQTTHLSLHIPTLELHDPAPETILLRKGEEEEHEDQDDADVDVDVDAELQAMLVEIQRCKTQIAQARRSTSSFS